MWICDCLYVNMKKVCSVRYDQTRLTEWFQFQDQGNQNKFLKKEWRVLFEQTYFTNKPNLLMHNNRGYNKSVRAQPIIENHPKSSRTKRIPSWEEKCPPERIQIKQKNNNPEINRWILSLSLSLYLSNASPLQFSILHPQGRLKGFCRTANKSNFF